MGMTRQPFERRSPCQCRFVRYRGLALLVFFLICRRHCFLLYCKLRTRCADVSFRRMETWSRMYQWLADESRAFSVR